jgi:hypothetical protein
VSAFDEWVEDAKRADILKVAQSLTTLKKAGRDYVGQCPKCMSSNTSFVITPGNKPEAQFLCRPGGAGGGVISMMAHVKGIEPKGRGFIQVCEMILQRPPPDRETTVRERDHEAAREEREESREDQWAREVAEAEKREWTVAQCRRLFESGRPFGGSGAEEYLRARAVFFTPEQSGDLRFIPSLAYWGHPDEHPDAPLVHLDDAPCMVAAIRDVSGAIIGAHRTYIDPKEPRKFRPPGSRDNRAKKISGQWKGGLIRLGPFMPVMAIGEGIETTGSWYALGVGPDEVGIAAGVAIANMSGAALEQVPPVQKSSRKSVPNGVPDMDRPGMILPPEVEHVIFLGDGDSDPEWTRQMILTGAEREFRNERKVEIHFSPDGMDWNDVMMQKRIGRVA